MLTVTIVMQAEEVGDDLRLKALWAVRQKYGEHAEALVSFTHKAHDVGALALVIAELAGRVEARPAAEAKSRLIT